MRQYRSAGSSQGISSLVESLEARCLLSYSPLAAPMLDQPAIPVLLAAPRAAAKVTIPNMVGHYTGKLKVKKFFVTKSFNIDLVVTSQTGSKVTGTVTVEGLGSKMTYTGTVNVKRHMVINFKKSGYSGTLTGDISTNGRKITGTGQAKGPVDLSGDLELNKVGK